MGIGRILIAGALGLTMASGIASAAELTGTLKKIKENGKITLGVSDSNLPFSYLDDKQAYQGYGIDLCKPILEAIKKRIGVTELKVEMVPVTSSTRIPLMVNGTLDLYCTSVANTVERQKQVAFSKTIFVAQPSLVVKKSSNIKSIQDMKGKTIVSTSGATDVKQMHEENAQFNLGMNITVAPDHLSSFMTMESGRAAAFQMGDVLVAGLIAASKSPADYEIVRLDHLPPEPWTFMMRRDDPEFKKIVDDTLVGIFTSGEIEKIYNKWFVSPIPPNGQNLNLPLGDKTRKIFANPTDSADPNAYK